MQKLKKPKNPNQYQYYNTGSLTLSGIPLEPYQYQCTLGEISNWGCRPLPLHTWEPQGTDPTSAHTTLRYFIKGGQSTCEVFGLIPFSLSILSPLSSYT